MRPFVTRVMKPVLKWRPSPADPFTLAASSIPVWLDVTWFAPAS